MGVPSTIGKNGMCVTLGGKHDGYCPISDIGDAKVGERALFKVMSSNNEDAMPNFIQEQGSTLGIDYVASAKCRTYSGESAQGCSWEKRK